MPYIKEDRRAALWGESTSDYDFTRRNAGELNYWITEIVQEYLLAHGLNYQHINDCIGALEGVKLELYRRLVVPYEDLKIKENTDVYNKRLLALVRPKKTRGKHGKK
jgi:hypothetical protein